MPPKHKLHKTTGKLKTFPTLPPQQPSTSNETFDVNSEAAQQFESELCWCIQQLQNALKNGKLNQKQVQDNTKALNILMSNSSPIIKKRQVMRMSFGDYRSLMAAEDKKFRSVNSKLKLTQGKPSKSSVFIKKSAFAKMNGNNFQFNFPQPKDNEITELVSNININSATTNVETTDNKDSAVNKEFHFVPTGNAFKFNFINLDNSEQ